MKKNQKITFAIIILVLFSLTGCHEYKYWERSPYKTEERKLTDSTSEIVFLRENASIHQIDTSMGGGIQLSRTRYYENQKHKALRKQEK